MSRIALSPNASGTGVFTISSPATNTNRTLVLPDEAGTVLTSASNILAQAQTNNPCFFATKSVDQTSVPDSVETNVTFDVERFDVGGIWNTSTNRIEVDATTAGYYYVSCSLLCNTTDIIYNGFIRLRKNGTIYVENYNASNVSSSASSTDVVLRVGTIIDLTTSGDYADITISFDIANAGTTNVNQIDSTRSRTHLSAHRVSL